MKRIPCQAKINVEKCNFPLTEAWLIDRFVEPTEYTEIRCGSDVYAAIKERGWIDKYKLYMNEIWQGLDTQLQPDCIVEISGCEYCDCPYTQETHITKVVFE